MANPANLTNQKLAINGGSTKQAFQVIDTNGTINCPIKSNTDRIFIDVENADDAAVTVTVKGGTGVQSIQSKDTAFAFPASGNAGDKKFLGPFESSRVIKSDGSFDIAVLAASGAPNLNIRVIQLPKM